MPAVSKGQRQAAGMATAIQQGKMEPVTGTPSAEMAQMAPGSLKEFAKTPEQGLPQRVKPPTVKRKPGSLGRTKVTKTGTMRKRAF
jgi:hypothetical protein